MKRTKLKDRTLPRYCLGEELINAISHGIGALLGIVVLIMCICKAVRLGQPAGIVGAAIYGTSMILLYTISTLYHALRPGTAKKVFQVLDHCTIYLLISGTYTPILLSGLFPHKPLLTWGMLLLQWGAAAVGISLNAVDLRKYRVFSMLCYLIMGWAILLIAPDALRLLSHTGLLYILIGGICYSVGAVLYGIGAKKPWFHSAFHLFVLAGTLFQFWGIYGYIL